MSDHIPREVLIDILKRLTIEDLVRSTTVCKSWYSLITSPLFISIHTKQQLSATSKNTDLLLLRECTEEFESDAPDRERYSIHSHRSDHTFDLYKSLDFPFKSDNTYFTVIGCCNGVICLSDDYVTILHVIILWNPSIKNSLTLPEPLVTYDSHGPFKHCIGFGFNAATESFKLVRVVYLMGDDVMDYAPPMVEVYELSVGSWRTVDPKGFTYVLDRASQVFLNNSVHWVGYSRVKVDGGSLERMIVSFDLRTDVFGMIKFPPCVADQGCPWGFSVSTCGESLALIQTIFSVNYEKTCCVWVMKQYGVADSWAKLFNIDLTDGLLKLCGVLKNEAALVIVDQSERPYSHEEALVSYDPKSKHRNRIGETRNSTSVFVDYFVETLALLGVKGGESDSVQTVVSKQSIPCSRRKRKRRMRSKNKKQEVKKDQLST